MLRIAWNFSSMFLVSLSSISWMSIVCILLSSGSNYLESILCLLGESISLDSGATTEDLGLVPRPMPPNILAPKLELDSCLRPMLLGLISSCSSVLCFLRIRGSWCEALKLSNMMLTFFSLLATEWKEGWFLSVGRLYEGLLEPLLSVPPPAYTEFEIPEPIRREESYECDSKLSLSESWEFSSIAFRVTGFCWVLVITSAFELWFFLF